MFIGIFYKSDDVINIPSIPCIYYNNADTTNNTLPGARPLAPTPDPVPTQMHSLPSSAIAAHPEQLVPIPRPKPVPSGPEPIPIPADPEPIPEPVPQVHPAAASPPAGIDPIPGLKQPDPDRTPCPYPRC